MMQQREYDERAHCMQGHGRKLNWIQWIAPSAYNSPYFYIFIIILLKFHHRNFYDIISSSSRPLILYILSPWCCFLGWRAIPQDWPTHIFCLLIQPLVCQRVLIFLCSHLFVSLSLKPFTKFLVPCSCNKLRLHLIETHSQLKMLLPKCCSTPVTDAIDVVFLMLLLLMMMIVIMHGDNDAAGDLSWADTAMYFIMFIMFFNSSYCDSIPWH